MTAKNTAQTTQSAERYHNVRRKVFFQEILSLVRGRSPELLSFEAVQSALKAHQQIESREPSIIPLDKIIGSVGRYRDFTREFLPKESVSQDRWRSVDMAMHSSTGLPAIEVYQIGDAYFVRDGHHRVSVARANGLHDIEAYVTRLETAVPISPETKAEDLALKAAYADFLRQTQLDTLRPDVDLEVTEIASYHELLQHIVVRRHYLGLELQREIPWPEAVTSWYDYVYLPVAAAIWASDIMDSFPERTAADLYLWVCRHREELAKEQGSLPSPVKTVSDLPRKDSQTKAGVVSSVKRALVRKPKSADLSAEAAQVDSPSSKENGPGGEA